jgi:hypothetical protein
MLCEKSLVDVSIAVFALTIMIFSFGCTFYGLYRYTFNMVKDEEQYSPWFVTDHLILAGNILQVASLAGTLYFVQAVRDPLIKMIITSSTFLLLIIILYLTNYDSGDKFIEASGWTGMVLLVIDLYIKVTAVFLGFGVCSLPEASTLLNSATKTLLGGSRKRR